MQEELSWGASANDFLMQTQADILNAPIERPACIESTAMGAAYLAGLAVGYWKDKDEVIANRRCDRVFTPQIFEEERNTRIEGWKRAVKRTMNWEM